MASKARLTYFDGMGLGEPIRLLLAYGGVDYEDVRIKMEDWPKIKNNMPFGKMPMLEIDGKVLHQSVAIARYLGKRFTIDGANEWEDLQCDMMVDTVTDLRMNVTNFFQEKDEIKKKAMLDTFMKETLPYYLNKFDEEVKKNSGYFVGGKLTWADVYIVAVFDFLQVLLKLNFLDDGTYQNLKRWKTSVVSVASIKAWVDKRPKSIF